MALLYAAQRRLVSFSLTKTTLGRRRSSRQPPVRWIGGGSRRAHFRTGLGRSAHCLLKIDANLFEELLGRHPR
ncbi:hypothetical protein, partial [Pseudomonas sp. MPR-AND1A]|uniref:hypothetical protein n=1 Tax=Pseudomonas sp. MPR-AND1A TaxID=2070600 RepID=UPI001C4655B0